MHEYKISVAISVYKKDNPKYFEQALKSVYGQTLLPDEVVLVIDGLVSEEILNIIDQFKKELYNKIAIKIIQLPQNVGLGRALNIAVNNCTYEYIARMDSDDICIPERFQLQIEKFKLENDLSVVGGGIVEFVNDINNVVGIRTVPTKHADIIKFMKRRCPFNHVTVMFKKSAVLNAGNYKHLLYNEDYYLWIRLFQEGAKFANLAGNLVYVRVGKEMYKRRCCQVYFKSEYFIQKYLLKYKIIGKRTFLENILIRVIVQLILPNSVRGWFFKKFARQTKILDRKKHRR